jgi:hypothetical protein
MNTNTLYTITKDSTAYFAKKESGEKGYNLYSLATNEIKVPKFITLPSAFHKKYMEKMNEEDTDQSMPMDVYEGIANAYESLERDCISVRSSTKDGESTSHLKTFLYITELDSVIKAIKESWKSAPLEVSLILQEMIDSDMSGILYTGNPINGKSNEILIKAFYGVGGGALSPMDGADTYILSKKDGRIIEKNIVEKITKLGRDPIQQTSLNIEVPLNEQNAEVLDLKKLNLLYEISNKIETVFGRPQEVEWAIKDGELYILQTHGVSAQIQNRFEKLHLWDNSHILENNGSLTMPLSFDFANYIYHQASIEFCEILLVPQTQIKEMDHFLKNMLGLFNGRPYYNLFNWYKLTGILPGHKYNRSFMEAILGTDAGIDDKTAEKIRPQEFSKGVLAKIRLFITGSKFTYIHFNIQNIIDDFLVEFQKDYNKFRRIDYSRLSSDNIYEHYLSLEREMLWKWHAPIINEFLFMVHYGVLKKLTKKWLPKLGNNFEDALLGGDKNPESRWPTNRLITLSHYVSKKPLLKELIFMTPDDVCLEAINQSQFQEFYHMTLEYIDKYGFPYMSEMKLEQLDMHQRPGLFFTLLKSFLQTDQTDVSEYEKRENETKEKAAQLLQNNISGMKKVIYNWSLKNTRNAGINRQSTRICRTRIYSVVRSMFYAIGEDFTINNIIDKKEDIFFLSLDELKGALEGTSTIQNIRLVIDLRKQEYAGFSTADVPTRFTTRGPVYWNNH